MNLQIAVVINENMLASYTTSKNDVYVLHSSVLRGAVSRTQTWGFHHLIGKNDTVRYATKQDFEDFNYSGYGWSDYNGVLIYQSLDRIKLEVSNYRLFDYPYYINRKGEPIENNKPTYEVGELVYVENEGYAVVLGCVDDESEELRTDLCGMVSYSQIKPVFLSDYLTGKYGDILDEKISNEIEKQISNEIAENGFFPSFNHLNDNPNFYPDGLYNLYVAMCYDLEVNGGDKYSKCVTYNKLFENFEYSFDWGLDAEPIDLKKID